MKNPNGYGSITKLKGRNLRKPYNVRITVKMEDGKQKKKSLGYYSTKEAALDALHAYQENKYNINYRLKTFDELWCEWVKTKTEDETLSDSTRKGYKYSYNKISDNIKQKIFVDILFSDLQDMFNDLRKSIHYDSLRKVRGDISQLYDYAINNKIVSANFVRNINIGHSRRKGEVLTFSNEQIKHLWTIYKTGMGNEQAQFTAKVMLMLIYNGCRISEFLSLEIKDVFISDNYFVINKAKTSAGIRKIPIHKEIKPLYQEFYKNYNKYLIPFGTKKFSYGNFRDSYWDRFIVENNWNPELTPHNARKTCSSLLKRYNADTMYQKLILGHEGALSLTEKVYTNVDVDKLVETINLIPAPYDLI